MAKVDAVFDWRRHRQAKPPTIAGAEGAGRFFMALPYWEMAKEGTVFRCCAQG